MIGRYARKLASSVLALFLVVATGVAQADQKSLLPGSHQIHEFYAQLAADWLEWILAIPAGINPLLDTDGAHAAIGQSGRVWFLAGTTTSGTVTRAISVPAGTALFFPIVNYFWINATEFGDPPSSPEQEASVRAFLAETVDTTHDPVLEVDGWRVMGVHRLRVRSALGACTVPDDNIFGVVFEPGPHDCVGDGYWALRPPLSPGRHSVRFAGGFEAGGFEAGGFALDVTYDVTVKHRWPADVGRGQDCVQEAVESELRAAKRVVCSDQAGVRASGRLIGRFTSVVGGGSARSWRSRGTHSWPSFAGKMCTPGSRCRSIGRRAPVPILSRAAP